MQGAFARSLAWCLERRRPSGPKFHQSADPLGKEHVAPWSLGLLGVQPEVMRWGVWPFGGAVHPAPCGRPAVSAAGVALLCVHGGCLGWCPLL